MRPHPLNKIGAAVLALNPHLAGKSATGRVLVVGHDVATSSTVIKVKKRGRRGPTNAELRYASTFLVGTDHAWEDVSFRLADTHFYTPDWVVRVRGVPVECIEVSAIGKNGFKKVSYQRSKLAFDQCKKDRPGIQWTWAELGADKRWTIC